MGNRFASFYRCLAFARFWKVKFWRSFIKCQYFNDGRIFTKNMYLYIFILGFFSKTGKTRVSHRVKMMTRWPGRERWPKWPIDPVTQWPSSMSDPLVASATHCVRRLMEQPAGQRDICPVSVNLPSAFNNVSVPGLVPWHYRRSPENYSPAPVDPGVILLLGSWATPKNTWLKWITWLIDWLTTASETSLLDAAECAAVSHVGGNRTFPGQDFSPTSIINYSWIADRPREHYRRAIGNPGRPMIQDFQHSTLTCCLSECVEWLASLPTGKLTRFSLLLLLLLLLHVNHSAYSIVDKNARTFPQMLESSCQAMTGKSTV